MRFLKAVILLFIIVSLSGCMTPHREPPVYSRELARVGDFIIKEDVLRFRLRLEMAKYPEGHFQKPAPGEGMQPEFKALLDEVFKKLISDYTIMAYGEKKGIQLDAKLINQKVEERKKQWNPKAFENFLNDKNIPYSRWKQLVETEAKVKLILKHELQKKVKLSFDEVRSYYHKNRNDFNVPVRVRARQLVTDTLEKANELHEKLLKGANFAKMAINHSLSPDRARGGDLGYFSPGSYPKEFDEACFKLQKGEISPVVKSQYGYHIFKLLDKKPAGRQAFEEVAPKIQSLLYEKRAREAYDSWIQSVESQVLVKIQNEILENFIL